MRLDKSRTGMLGTLIEQLLVTLILKTSKLFNGFIE